MLVYLNPKAVGRINFMELTARFPEVRFITDEEEAAQAEVCVIMPNFFKTNDISKFHNLKWVQLLMAGYDNFDFSVFNEKDVVVSNAVDIFSNTVAEDVFAKIFVLNRNVSHYLKAMKSGSWSPIRKEPELTGSVFGIIGAGSIGRAVSKRAKAFEAYTIGYRRNPLQDPDFDEIVTGAEGLEFLLRKSDYVIVACPLTDETRNLIDAKRISMMKKDALLINVARGAIVDQDALTKALEQEDIRGAGLDVTTPEPLPADHLLWRLPNVYITPHNASSSPYMQSRLKDLVIHNLSRYLAGKDPDYIVYQNKGA